MLRCRMPMLHLIFFFITSLLVSDLILPPQPSLPEPSPRAIGNELYANFLALGDPEVNDK